MKHMRRWMRLCVLLGLLVSALVVANPVAAQDGEAEGFPLTAFAAYCEPGYLGPFVGCTPWVGVTVTFVAIDASYSATCVTEAGEGAASCAVRVPFGSTIEASIDPATVPAGYVLQGAALQQLTIPDGPPEGLFGGPTFVLLPADDTGEEPAGEEPGEYVPPVIGDEPQTDPGPIADDTDDARGVIALPSTGAGVATPETPNAAMPMLLLGASTMLVAGAMGVRKGLHHR